MAELRKYGVQTTFYFPLIDRGQADFEITPVTHAVGDTKFDKDGAGFGNTTNAFAHRGLGIYSIVLTAAEMQATNIVITIVDQTVPKAWEDQAILIDTGFDARLLKYVQLMVRKDYAISQDNAAEVTAINADEGSGAGTFLNETDALESIRDQGDQAWLTGGSGGATKRYITTDWTRTVGDNDGGVAADTATVNGTYFSTGETAAGTYLEVDAVFTLDAVTETAVEVDFWGFYDGGGNHMMLVEALDTIGAVYEPIGELALGTIVVKHRFELSPQHTNAATGVVTIKFLHVGNGNAAHVFSVDKCQVNSTVPSTTAAKQLSYMQLLVRSDAAINTDRTVELGELNANEGTGAGDFDNQTDAVEALRDRGDAAWITAVTVSVGDKTGFSLAADGLDLQTSWTTDITGNLSGSVGSVTGAVGSVTGAVGSVTGAVGSVTGNVGGNVTGSVGSVVGAVGSVTGAVGSVTGNVGGNVVGTVASVVGAVGSVAGNVGGNVVGSTASVVGAVGSVAGNVDGNVTGNLGGNVLGNVAGNVAGNLGGNVVGTLGGMTVAALAQFFTTDSGETYLTSVAGSVVMEIANARVGTGANIFVLTVVDGGAAPIPGVSAWISDDAAGATMVAGPLATDASGEVVFLLDDGTYYLWKQLAGYTFTNPESQVVNAGALTHTSTGTAVGTAALTQWSVNTLSKHLLGFFNQARNAAGGTTPDRVKDEVRNSLRYIWDVEDWRHEVDIDTLALAADGTTITLPQDYRKAGATVLTDVDDAVELPITDSLTKWQKMDDLYEATDTGHPVLAAIIYDTAEACDWLMKTTPASDAVYSFEFPYYKRCPVDLPAGHGDLKGDADSIPMPTAFHKLWELHAWWQIQEHFTKEVAPAERAQKTYEKAHRAAVDEQNETVAEPTHPAARGYTDGHLFSSGEYGRHDDYHRLPED